MLVRKDIDVKEHEKLSKLHLDIQNVLFLLAIVLSVLLRYTDSDCPFGIFKLFIKQNNSSFIVVSLISVDRLIDCLLVACSNIPAASPFGVYISQLIQYSRACGYYHDCLGIVILLTKKLMHQWFLVFKLKSLLRMFGILGQGRCK